jgi:hypothetical protein
VSDHVPEATLLIRRFVVVRRALDGAFSYRPELTVEGASGRGRLSIKKVTFELLDVGASGQTLILWNPADVIGGRAVTVVPGYDGTGMFHDLRSRAEAPRMSTTVSYVDDSGRGGVISAVAAVVR